jgi:hypothetical protein
MGHGRLMDEDERHHQEKGHVKLVKPPRLVGVGW